MSIDLCLLCQTATSAPIDNRAIDISQIFDVPLEAVHGHIFSVVSPEKSRSRRFFLKFININRYVNR